MDAQASASSDETTAFSHDIHAPVSLPAGGAGQDGQVTAVTAEGVLPDHASVTAHCVASEDQVSSAIWATFFQWPQAQLAYL